MVQINLDGCKTFIEAAQYDKTAALALEAFDTLIAGDGAGNDFLGWKTLPSDTPDKLIADCEAVRDDWKALGADLVVVIGIGGSYLGAKCAIEALSHSFLPSDNAPRIVFAGNNLSEEYLAELTDLME